MDFQANSEGTQWEREKAHFYCFFWKFLEGRLQWNCKSERVIRCKWHLEDWNANFRHCQNRNCFSGFMRWSDRWIIWEFGFSNLGRRKLEDCEGFFFFLKLKMGNIESVDGQSEMKHHIMPLKVPMPDPTELEEKFAIVLVSWWSRPFFSVMSGKTFGSCAGLWFPFETFVRAKINATRFDYWFDYTGCVIYYDPPICKRTDLCRSAPHSLHVAPPLSLPPSAVLLSPLKSEQLGFWLKWQTERSMVGQIQRGGGFDCTHLAARPSG